MSALFEIAHVEHLIVSRIFEFRLLQTHALGNVMPRRVSFVEQWHFVDSNRLMHVSSGDALSLRLVVPEMVVHQVPL